MPSNHPLTYRQSNITQRWLKQSINPLIRVIATVIIVTLLPYSSTLTLPNGDPAPGRSPGPPDLKVEDVNPSIEYVETTTAEAIETTVSELSDVIDACAFARVPSDSDEIVTLSIEESDVNLTVTHPVFETRELVKGVVYDGTPALRPSDWLLEWPEEVSDANPVQTAPEPQPDPNPPSVVSPETDSTGVNPTNLDTEILEILGEDPTCSEKFGPEVRSELANRLLHISREGLSKETRKTLISKYLLPSNCAQLDAPKINLEIKAAIPDTAFKRDKGIETKQKQMTAALACLSVILNEQINSATKNNELLQKLMDISRILCDIQHGDSVTRRNFILFALKNDFKEHLKNTKIDSYLFGENLSETLKSAKAVNKSGGEMKIDVNKTNTKFRGTAPRPLNRKAPPQARKPLVGAAPPALRSREPVPARAPFHPPAHPPHQAPHAQSSRTSSQTQHTAYPRRRF